MMIAFLISFMVIHLLIRYGVCQTPNNRSAHLVPTPASGGIAIFCGFFCASFFEDLSFIPQKIWIFYFLCAFVLSLIGWLDDYYQLSYKLRLLVHIVVALMLMSSGLVLSVDGSIAIFYQKLLSVFVFITLINAANFCDGINGLLSICFLICLATQYILCPEFFVFVKLFMSASLPFVIMNFPNARIFLGDAGSTFLGATLGFIAIMNPIINPQDPGTVFVHKGFVLSLMPMSFLWFDVFFTLCHRIVRKQKLSQAHQEHMFHILYNANFSHTKITLFYASGSLFLSFLIMLYCKSFINFVTLFSIYAIVQIFVLHFVWKLKKF